MIRASSNCNVTLSGSSMKYNLAQEAGAIQIDNKAKLTASSIKISGNYAYNTAGAIQVMTKSTLDIEKSMISDNYA